MIKRLKSTTEAALRSVDLSRRAVADSRAILSRVQHALNRSTVKSG
jgi:hypothetical protein